MAGDEGKKSDLKTRLGRANEPVVALKGEVERQKSVVFETQASINRAKGSSEGWRRIAGLQRDLEREVKKLRELKQRLRELSGTTEGDPKWKLLARAHAVLSALDDGVDVSAAVKTLIEEIEWHVPGVKLDEAAEKLAKESEPEKARTQALIELQFGGLAPVETVHLLHEGWSLCDMSSRFGVPGNWPPGNTWVGVADLSVGLKEWADNIAKVKTGASPCTGCVTVYPGFAPPR